MDNMQKSYRHFFSEFAAALIFTVAYFVFAGRAESESFKYTYLQVALFTSMLYIFSVFISSYNYKIDIFPAFSLMRCFVEKTLSPLFVNIPAQILGAFAGLLIYLQLQSTVLHLSPIHDNNVFVSLHIDDVILRSFIFTILVYILSYLMVLVRYSFRLVSLTGTLLISVVVFIISAITLPLDSVSVITLWQDILLSFYHYRFHMGDLVAQSLKQITIAIPLLGAGAALAYFKLSDLMEDNIAVSEDEDEEMEVPEEKQLDTNFDI